MTQSELIQAVAVLLTVGAHWFDSVRRSSRVESKVDDVESKVDLLDHRFGRLEEESKDTGQRVARIEGRLNGGS